jgi:cation diffusion facilitator CzcD-associated flavoprotein CzcO
MTAPPEGTPQFDRAAVEKKYAEERQRRMLARQREIRDLAHDSRFSRYLEDPFTAFAAREPLSEDLDVAVVGAGIAGVVTGARLREAGELRIRLIDSAGGIGGTWYWNRYPGVMCDVESYIYMPMLEEMNYVPRTRYALGEEIRQHVDAIARKYDLVDGALFHTRVLESRWDEGRARWILTTDRGDEIRARYVVMAVGILNLVKLPVIPGMETFRGKAFHSARWDYAYTGGGPGDPNLTRLADKAVGIVGTGASAIQCVPPLAESARHLYVFQRTPSAIGVRGNAPTPQDFADHLEPGWQKKRMENFTAVMAGRSVDRDLVDDGWTHHMAKLLSPRIEPGMSVDQVMAAAEAFDFSVMEEHRTRVAEIVADPRRAEILKPYYRYLCKRPCFHDEYLAAFNRPNVTLVDCPGGIERVTEHGVVANGELYALDCIVYATGFEAEATPFPRRAGHPILGRGGRKMEEKWKDGALTLHGMMTRGFPNLFISPAPAQQAVVSVNHTHIMVTGAEHIAQTIARLDARGVRIADVSEAAEAGWVQQIVGGYVDGSDFLAACTPSRFNFEGDPSIANPRNGSYGAGYGDYFAWRDLLVQWRAANDFPGLELDQPYDEDRHRSDPASKRRRLDSG